MAKSFIHDLVDEVLPDVETPESWIYWSLMACISAAAANNYYSSSFSGKHIYYPNIYVILYGESGLGKAFGISLAKKLFNKSDITRAIIGRSSIQGIVKEMATTRSAAGKPVITDSRAFLINGELSTGLISDPDALTILTDLFDRNDNPDWTNLLKGDGPEKLIKPYVTCLFGSSPAHFFDKIPQANIDGGYIGRNLIIHEDKRSKHIDPLSADDGKDSEATDDEFTAHLAAKYLPHLVNISKQPKTRLRFEEAGRLRYNKWRREWREGQKSYNDNTGFINRVPDHVMKVAMCLTLSKGLTTIGESEFTEAITKVSSLVYASQNTVAGSGIDPTAQQTKKVLDFLLSAKENKLYRQDLLRLTYGNLDPISLDRSIDTLLEMKWISRQKANNDWLILLTGEPLERLRKFREGQKK